MQKLQALQALAHNILDVLKPETPEVVPLTKVVKGDSKRLKDQTKVSVIMCESLIHDSTPGMSMGVQFTDIFQYVCLNFRVFHVSLYVSNNLDGNLTVCHPVICKDHAAEGAITKQFQQRVLLIQNHALLPTKVHDLFFATSNLLFSFTLFVASTDN